MECSESFIPQHYWPCSFVFLALSGIEWGSLCLNGFYESRTPLPNTFNVGLLLLFRALMGCIECLIFIALKRGTNEKQLHKKRPPVL